MTIAVDMGRKTTKTKTHDFFMHFKTFAASRGKPQHFRVDRHANNSGLILGIEKLKSMFKYHVNMDFRPFLHRYLFVELF